ncbi:MAG: hypothetical protein WB421_17305 [Terriglobales bacterium]
MNAKEDTRKNLVMKARVEEVRHNLRNQLDKEKKHQWYIYRKKNYPYSRDTKQQTSLETEIDPDVALPLTSRISNIPIMSLVVSSVGIAAGVLLVSNHMKK